MKFEMEKKKTMEEPILGFIKNDIALFKDMPPSEQRAAASLLEPITFTVN